MASAAMAFSVSVPLASNSASAFLVTASYAAVKVVQPIQQVSTDMIFAVGIQEASHADHFSWLVEGTILYFLKRDGGTQTILFSTTYSPTSHLPSSLTPRPTEPTGPTGPTEIGRASG